MSSASQTSNTSTAPPPEGRGQISSPASTPAASSDIVSDNLRAPAAETPRTRPNGNPWADVPRTVSPDRITGISYAAMAARRGPGPALPRLTITEASPPRIPTAAATTPTGTAQGEGNIQVLAQPHPTRPTVSANNMRPTSPLPPSSPPLSSPSTPTPSPTTVAIRRAAKGKGRAKPIGPRERSVSPQPSVASSRQTEGGPTSTQEPARNTAGESRKRRRIDSDPERLPQVEEDPRAQPLPPLFATPANDEDVVMRDSETPAPSSMPSLSVSPEIPIATPAILSTDPHRPCLVRRGAFVVHATQTRSPSTSVGSPPPSNMPSSSTADIFAPSRSSYDSLHPPPYNFLEEAPPPYALHGDHRNAPRRPRHEHGEPYFDAPPRPHHAPGLHGPGQQIIHPAGLIAPPPQLTRPPPDGWLQIQGDDHYWRIRGMAPDQLEAWLQDTRPAVLVQVPGVGTSDPGLWDRITAIRNLLRTYFGLCNVTITAALPAVAHNHLNTEPFFLIIRGIDLTWPRVDELVNQQWLFTPSITVNFEPFLFEPPTFIGAWRRIERFPDTSEEGIRRAFQRGFTSPTLSPVIRSAIQGDIENNGIWDGISIQDAFHSIVRSVRVRIIIWRRPGRTNEPLALLYCLPPTGYPPDWTTFREHAQLYQYGTITTGAPEFVTHHLWCTICHSTDHPTNDCYLPALPGWTGPRNPARRGGPAGPGGRGIGGRGGRGGRGNGRGNGRGGFGRGNGAPGAALQ